MRLLPCEPIRVAMRYLRGENPTARARADNSRASRITSAASHSLRIEAGRQVLQVPLAEVQQEPGYLIHDQPQELLALLRGGESGIALEALGRDVWEVEARRCHITEASSSHACDIPPIGDSRAWLSACEAMLQ